MYNKKKKIITLVWCNTAQLEVSRDINEYFIFKVMDEVHAGKFKAQPEGCNFDTFNKPFYNNTVLSLSFA